MMQILFTFKTRYRTTRTQGKRTQQSTFRGEGTGEARKGRDNVISRIQLKVQGFEKIPPGGGS